jgi:hypothetical protein
VTTSPTSYLQTLAKDEAIAFVKSLKKVKEHLSDELKWINEQLQQKTIQLQGIENLLSEAVALGLVESNAQSSTPPESVTKTTTSPPITASATSNGGSPVASSVDLNIATPSITTPSTSQKRGSQRKKTSSKTQSKSKPPAKAKTSVAKAKTTDSSVVGKSNPLRRSISKASKPKEASGLQEFLQRSFRDKTLTDSVGEILARSKKPLSISEVVNELYTDLSGENYKQAKDSIGNVLAVGRRKGRWKTTGKGLYASNTVANS